MGRIGAWLRRFLDARSVEEMSGIELTEPRWEVAGKRVDPAVFFRSLSNLIPNKATLVLEGGAHPAELQTLLHAHAIPGEARVALGTVWPRASVFHLPATPEVLAALAKVSDYCAQPEVCQHLYVYEKDTVLLEWHDAFDDPFYLSKRVQRRAVEAFCRELGVGFRELENTPKVERPHA